MIVTVSPNPSLDRTMSIDRLGHGDVVRSPRSYNEPSGKGVNVAVALHANAIDVVTVLPAGGFNGVQVTGMLAELGVPHIAVPIAEEIRSNVSLVEPDATVTKINEVGPTLDTAEATSLVREALGQVKAHDWLVLCGTLPEGPVERLYIDLVKGAHGRTARVAVDTSGEPLRTVLPYGPDLVKPNAGELAELTGRALETLGDVVDAAQEIRRRGARAVLASLGSDGAILLDDSGCLFGQAQVDRVVSTVGAGDALLAGFLAGGANGRQALHEGLAWAAAAVQNEGTLYRGCKPQIRVDISDDLDRNRALQEPCTAAGLPAGSMA
ncbi:1-phosphofructokinase family hexose kinase [Paenarthrobacter nitroguajacolicus]|uniref:1-phosphofructokinase family hexose kinase n=1 Tax=Paenarthrobacter nitroguajacolicus TaxID=211146 RepID=UPI00248B260D|nr:1-phosphofructokinase family hexose kinase [Paenarthrobacter nitroguajacolicus]MDI2035144.1 Tagatose-6-phosphate kinase [Paenarthrobacter nitroguajacolicus]